MRKIITCMILGLLSLVSCTEYDEVAMWNKNEDMGSRLAALEELCSQLNTNIVFAATDCRGPARQRLCDGSGPGRGKR